MKKTIKNTTVILNDIENPRLIFWGFFPLFLYSTSLIFSFSHFNTIAVGLYLLFFFFAVPDLWACYISCINPYWFDSSARLIKISMVTIFTSIILKLVIAQSLFFSLIFLCGESIRLLLIFYLKSRCTEFVELLNSSEEIYLGKTDTGKSITIKDDHSRCSHTLISGPTGIGKTFAALSPLVYHDIKTSKHVVVIDYKGDLGFLNNVYSWSHKYDREFILIDTLLPEYSSAYNPFALGDPDLTKEKMIAAKVWSEVHYKDISTDALLEACIELYSHKSSVTMADILPFIEGRSDTSGVASFLRSLLNSGAGHIFTSNPTSGAKEFFDKNAVVYYRCPAELSPELSKQLARLILSDYKALSAIQKGVSKVEQHPISLFVDEAPKFINEEFDDFLTMARSANIRVHILTQGILAFQKLGKGFISSLLDNTQYKFLMNSTSPEATDILSKSIGTREIEIKTYQTENDLGEKRTGLGSMRKGRELIVHSDVLKHLRKGEMILSCDLNNRQEKLYLDNFLYREFEERNYFKDKEETIEFKNNLERLKKYKSKLVGNINEKNKKREISKKSAPSGQSSTERRRHYG